MSNQLSGISRTSTRAMRSPLPPKFEIETRSQARTSGYVAGMVTSPDQGATDRENNVWKAGRHWNSLSGSVGRRNHDIQRRSDPESDAITAGHASTDIAGEAESRLTREQKTDVVGARREEVATR